MSSRITGGRFSSRRLAFPKGPPIRPTLDQVRQAIFNLLGSRVVGARVLDLFSGSGALGIEALSRGASFVLFVDRSFFCVQAIRENLEQLPAEPARVEVVRAELLTALRRLHRQGESRFDLVFADPPYGKDLARKTLIALTRYAIVSPQGLVVLEHDKRDLLPPEVSGSEGRFLLQRSQRYGDTAVALYGRPAS